MNRQELKEWFICLCRENSAICSYCDEVDCNTCQRFQNIKGELHKCGYFVDREYFQPIAWEIYEIYLLTDKPYKLAVHIDRTVRFNYLISEFDFVSCKIIDVRI